MGKPVEAATRSGPRGRAASCTSPWTRSPPLEGGLGLMRAVHSPAGLGSAPALLVLTSEQRRHLWPRVTDSVRAPRTPLQTARAAGRLGPSATPARHGLPARRQHEAHSPAEDVFMTHALRARN